MRPSGRPPSFVHGVNRRARLDAALASGRGAFEGDVSWGRLRGGGETAIMAHPPDVESDLSFAEWLGESLAAGRRCKIDLKDRRAADAVIAHLIGVAPPHDRYVVNADMVVGPGGALPRFAVADALAWRAVLGTVTVSLGSTTGGAVPYGEEDVDRLLAAAAAIGEPLTVCLEVGRLEVDPTALERVAAAGHHLSLWCAAPQVEAVFARYRARLPEAWIDLFDDTRAPLGPR